MAIDPKAIIHPQAANSLYDTMSQLQSPHSLISNRLHSIANDALSVGPVAWDYGFVVVANQRSGSWYVNPELQADPVDAYFKSTDGHFGQWAFSLRRLNLGVLDAMNQYDQGGCVIVDSTRKGKSMSDALAKTIPIWVTVFNRLLFPDDPTWHALRTPVNVVSASEHTQIESRMDGFLASVKNLELNLKALRRKLRGKPMKVEWLGKQSSHWPTLDPKPRKFNVLILYTASGASSTCDQMGEKYVPGAADDSESWARGLEARTWWKHQGKLLKTNEDDLPGVIDELVRACQPRILPAPPVRIEPATLLWVGDNTSALTQPFDVIISASAEPEPVLADTFGTRYIHLRCGEGKVGSRDLRTQLPRIEMLRPVVHDTSRILACCPTGTDLAVGIALAVACRFCDADGALCQDGPVSHVTKNLIQQRLSWILISAPRTSPSRATLSSVNHFLFG